MESLNSLDHQAFLFLNGLHCSWLDPVFFWGTKSVVWIPLYCLLTWLVVRQYKWNALWILFFAALMILFSDQIANFFKEWVARPRPGFEPGLQGIHHVNGYTGSGFGFYSAHASNNMALAIYVILLVNKPFRYFSALMVCYALFMAYTRIYLGVHYPGDLLAGFFAGGLLGWVFGQIAGWVVREKP